MSQDPFAVNPPLLVQTGKAIVQGIDDFMNGLIEKCGKFMDTCTAEVKGMGKAGISLGKPLEGGLASAPALSPNHTPSPTHQAGQEIKRSGPEITPQLAKAVEGVDMSFAKDTAIRKAAISEQQGMNFGGQDLCNLPPMNTPSCGVAVSQGRAA